MGRNSIKEKIMRMAEILRKLADIVDQNDSEEESQHQLIPVDVEEPEDCADAVMIPPLQAKLELLKKSEGVPSVYDDSDELDFIKKNAGLTIAQHIASEDNDIVG